MSPNSNSRMLFHRRDDEAKRSFPPPSTDPDDSAHPFPKTLPDLGPKYEAIRYVGQGGMGFVLETRHITLNQTRAIKLLRHDAVTLRPTVISRFRREAMITSDLSHPNIVRVYDFDQTPDGIPFIVMEFLDGESLEDLMAREKRIPPTRTVEILAAAAEALDAVHRIGVIHRDLKPANIFLTRTGDVKLLDFGISHIEHSQTRITQAGEVLGTLLYMAPEQLQNLPAGPRSDIFSLAATALEMLLERPIVQTEDARVLMARMVDPAPLVTTEELHPLPPHAAEALIRALSKNPAARFPSAGAFVNALAGLSIDGYPEIVHADSTPEFLGKYATAAFEHNGKTPQKNSALKRSLPRLFVLISLVLTLPAVLLFALSADVRHLLSSPTELTAVTLVLVEDNTDEATAASVQDPWTRKTAGALLRRYLLLDPRIHIASTASLAENSSNEQPYEVRYRTAGTDGDYRITLRLDRAPGAQAPWEITAQGASIETVVESGSYRLASVLPLKAPEQTDEISEGAAQLQLLEVSVENALLQGLFPRARRFVEGPLAEANDSFAVFSYRFTACEQTAHPTACRQKLIAPVSDRPDRAALIEQLERENRAPSEKNHVLCRLSGSDDPLVRAVAQASPAYARCGLDKGSICGRTDTFFDRLTCLRTSDIEDLPSAGLRYFEELSMVDPAQPEMLAAGTFLLWDENRTVANTWMKRMITRSGRHNPAAALALTRYYMAERNGVESLIWARRCARAGFEEGLALMSDGWLKSGLRRAAADTAVRASRAFSPYDPAVHELRAALLPVLALKSPLSADTWIDVVHSTGASGPLLEKVQTLMRAVSERRKDICDEDLSPFDAELRYYCGAADKTIPEHPVAAPVIKGYDARARAFYTAETYLRQNHLDIAARLYEDLRQDPLVRTEFPVAAALALERLGRIAEKQGDNETALRYYSDFLAAWPGLDIPLDAHIRAGTRIQRLTRSK